MTEHTTPDLGPARGLLHAKVSMEHFDLTRVSPSPALGDFIENYWIIEWDLRGKPDYCQENLPHPSPNLVIDPSGTTGLFGLQTERFTYTLSGQGRIFGTKFWPGALPSLVSKPMNSFTNSTLDVATLLARSTAQLERDFLAQNNPANFGQIIEELLLVNAPTLSSKSRFSRQIVEEFNGKTELFKVADAARLFDLSPRALQRLFETHIGASPKWVIDRYRMLEAVEVLNQGGQPHLTDLAQELGYHDQAHFIHAFKKLTGNTPSHYLSA